MILELFDSEEGTTVRIHSVDELKMLAIACMLSLKKGQHFTDLNNPEQLMAVLKAANYELQGGSETDIK